MSSNKRNRQSNIELLRIITIIGVIVLHINMPGMGNAMSLVEAGSPKAYILYLLETVFICAVDMFMLISGYFLYGKEKRDLWKPIALIVQVILFAEGLYIIHKIASAEPVTVRAMLHLLIPANYFVILYCTVYLISPFINILLKNMSEKSCRLLIVLSIMLFSIYPTAVDLLGEFDGISYVGLSSIGAFGSQWGYNIVNFSLMYLVGACLNKYKEKTDSISTRKFAAALVVCVAVLMLWAVVNDRVGYSTVRSAWEYCNPLVIAESAIIFVLFQRIRIGTSPVINSLSKCCFTVYLLNETLLHFIPVGDIVSKSAPVMLLLVLGSATAAFLAAWVVHFLYAATTDPVFNILKKVWKLPVLEAEFSEKD